MDRVLCCPPEFPPKTTNPPNPSQKTQHVLGASLGGLVYQQAVAPGIRRCLGAIRRAGFGQNVTHVRSDGVEADVEGVSNLSVALARGQKAQHLDLALAVVFQMNGHTDRMAFRMAFCPCP